MVLILAAIIPQPEGLIDMVCCPNCGKRLGDGACTGTFVCSKKCQREYEID